MSDARRRPVGEPVRQRLAFVLPTTGEFDSRTRRMAASLAGRGHEVRVIARRDPGLSDIERWPGGVEVVRVDATPPSAPLPRMVRVALAAYRQAAAAARLELAADVYHVMGFLALPAGRRLVERARLAAASVSGAHPPRLVYDVRDLYAEANNVARLPAPLRGVFAARERGWARSADAVLTVNESLAQVLGQRWGIAATVVMNAQPRWQPPTPRPDLIRARLGIAVSSPILLYHGGFMPDRGLPELIAAHRDSRLAATHLVLLGSGALEAKLRALAAEPASAGRVHLLPPVPPSELLAWVASADMCVMPNQPRTLNERLSTPNKLFESLAAGVPVVSSDFPERRRIVLQDPLGPLGAVCDPRNPTALADAIAGIALLPAEASSAVRARCLAAAHARYAWEDQLDVLLGTYSRLTGRPW